MQKRANCDSILHRANAGGYRRSHRSNATCHDNDVCNAIKAHNPCRIGWYRAKCSVCGSRHDHDADFCQQFGEAFKQDPKSLPNSWSNMPPRIRKALERCDKPCIKNSKANCPSYSSYALCCAPQHSFATFARAVSLSLASGPRGCSMPLPTIVQATSHAAGAHRCPRPSLCSS